MNKYKIKIESCPGEKSFRWAFQILFFSISVSIMLGLLSQSVLTKVGAVVASVVILLFVFISVVFDMIGIAVASADEATFLLWRKDGVKGASAGLHLCENSNKVCSFCADVVGDVCSTLSGAAGTSIVVSASRLLGSASSTILLSTLVSALIAGFTIFFKAIMKQRAITNANKIILRLGRIIEPCFARHKKNNKSCKNS